MKTVLGYSFLIFAMIGLWSCDPEVAPDDVDIASEIAGEWLCESSDGEFAPITYTVTLSKVGTGKVKINNFHNFGLDNSVTVNVYADNTLELEEQTVDGTTFKGTGSIASSYQSMSLDYTATDTEGTQNITTSYSLGTISKKLQ